MVRLSSLPFAAAGLAAIGISSSFCYESPKPEEFGNVGLNWGPIGWRIDVTYRELKDRPRPKDHIAELRPLLPSRYAPLRANGNGSQTIYLTELSERLALELMRIIGPEAREVRETATRFESASAVSFDAIHTIDEWEQRVVDQIQSDTHLDDTERRAIVQARRGQGRFRDNVFSIERRCRVTRVDRPEHLIASHTKPWRDSTNEERLDGENGLLLTPSIDHLFDKGFISFENNGELIVSPVANRPALSRMGISMDERLNVGAFIARQKEFLDFHREHVLRMSNVKR